MAEQSGLRKKTATVAIEVLLLATALGLWVGISARNPAQTFDKSIDNTMMLLFDVAKWQLILQVWLREAKDASVTRWKFQFDLAAGHSEC